MGIVFNVFSHNDLRMGLIGAVLTHGYGDLNQKSSPQGTKGVRHRKARIFSIPDPA